MILDKVKKLFTGGEWRVAFKAKEDSAFQVVSLPKGLWAADPMLYKHGDKHYLFTEIYETAKKRAAIGYFEFINDVPVYQGLIIENDYHMSYPCVFAYGDSIYMIPESSANNSLDLYKAIDFPKKWEKECTLIDGCDYVDTTVYIKDKVVYLFSYKKVKEGWDLVTFTLDMKSKSLEEKDTLHFTKNIGRPAGCLIDNDVLLRPAQDSSRKYGEAIILNEVVSLSPYKEKLFKKLTISDFPISKKAKRIHTYGEDDRFVVVDYFIEQFELFHAFEIYKRSHFNKKAK